MDLYLNCASDYSIEDETGRKYSLEEAKKAVNEGRVSDCNQSFRRLMTYNYDLDAVKKFYREIDKIERERANT